MPTWVELDQQFRELAPALQFHRLDYQWGAAGVHYRLAGGGSSDATRRFEVLSRIAGLKLQELPPAALHEDVWLRGDPTERWYEALKHCFGAFEHSFVGSQDEAKERGYLWLVGTAIAGLVLAAMAL